jgi:hypothetical protein
MTGVSPKYQGWENMSGSWIDVSKHTQTFVDGWAWPVACSKFLLPCVHAGGSSENFEAQEYLAYQSWCACPVSGHQNHVSLGCMAAFWSFQKLATSGTNVGFDTSFLVTKTTL